MNKKTIQDIDVTGKKVFVRVDFNVPMDGDVITDDIRIRAAVPTIQYLLDHDAKVILASHMGRPKGQVNPKYSLKPCAQRLSELLGKPVLMAEDVVGDSAMSLAASLQAGQVMMIENVRFEAGEEKNAPELAKKMASMADIFVNDAFGTAHRAHASTAGVADYLPAVAGFLIEKEISVIGKALEAPGRPFVAILGGAKVKDKLGVIKNLLTKVDTLIIGGGMSYTFQTALGYSIGDSLLDAEKVDFCKEMMSLAKEKGVNLLLPVDAVAADSFSNDANRQVIEGDIPDGWQGLDIGPKTCKLFSDVIANAKTVIWNGPMGVFEFENFANGTKAVAQAMADSDAVTIIGGGDSAAAAEQLGFADKMTHISTGGGASLEFMEGIELPGIAVLNDR